MNGLSLFTGSGIGELVLKEIIPGYRTVGYVEWDKFCQRLIERRIQDGCLDDAPIWDDVRTFDGRPWAGRVDFISAGFPCQPFSVAGDRKAERDERNGWPDTFRLIGEIRPTYALLENVAALLSHRYAARIFADLTSIGFDAEWDVISAAFIGAPVYGERLWVLATSSGSVGRLWRDRRRNLSIEASRDGQAEWGEDRCVVEVAPGHSVRISRQWSHQPPIQRVVARMAGQLDRLKCVGNGWCPQVVARILTVEEE